MIEFYDYDKPVRVEAPPESEVVDEDDVRHVPEGPDPRTLLWSCTQAEALTEDALTACLDAYSDAVDDVSCGSTYVSPKLWTYRCSDGTAGRAEP
jgi:hypothetical protein